MVGPVGKYESLVSRFGRASVSTNWQEWPITAHRRRCSKWRRANQTQGDAWMSFDITLSPPSRASRQLSRHGIYPAHVAELFSRSRRGDAAVINVDSLDVGPSEMAYAAISAEKRSLPVVYSSEIGNTKADVYPARVDLSLETAISRAPGR